MKILVVLASVFAVVTAEAKSIEKMIEYKMNDKTFEGFMASPEKPGSYPAVLVVHDWMGITDRTKDVVKRLAEMGYVALAADIYGKGVRPKDGGEAGKLAGSFKKDRKLLRETANAAFKTLSEQKNVAKNKMAVIGYCFGGTTAIEVARSGTDLAGVVSFHGGLDSPSPADGKNIKGKVLALHGADDPFVPAPELAAFEKEMKDNKVDWELIKYGNAVHSFTDKSSGTDNSKGAAYNEKADKRSWIAMSQFLKEIF